jgi:hypothetical protein
MDKKIFENLQKYGNKSFDVEKVKNARGLNTMQEVTIEDLENSSLNNSD